MVALLRADGKEVVGENGWITKFGHKMKDVIDELNGLGVSPNFQTPTHAEGHVFYQMLKLLNGRTVKKAELFVDAAFCKSCGQNGGLRAFARAIGLEELIVHIRLKDGSVIQGAYKLTNG